MELCSGKSEFINHPALKFFYSLSTAAMVRGVEIKDDQMFNFGVELQWRVVLFRKVSSSFVYFVYLFILFVLVCFTKLELG